MIRPFLVGLGTTFRHMFKKKVAVNYPEQKVPMFPKYRGKQVLMRDENGLEKCVACGLCSVACPADAIYMEAAENDGTVLAGPRYASVYQIHKNALYLLWVLRRGLPGVGHLHGQGPTSWLSTARTTSSGTRPTCSFQRRPTRSRQRLSKSQRPNPKA